ncbi:TPA: hypothetical protein ACPGBO_001726 [Haemophilus influenzae]|uniref:hypothetical protein n=1 Tax=Haemophilus influenzae TaxID=727 RepID=UPI001304C53F|nr:hypothetical protein [Haemophilus influenzae]MBZ5690568.1 hypothetical protein [Haemophilus influenzae]MCK8818605.1 hypothetical protein [Haemophilus influenzae]MCK8843666.1 hypothetical protein [Haemophilus influenzae]MCK8850414.1 hypothetical protein [Haemophilus influenzae]MCK8873567.1 hypothetical protein [Haemophilus influenzae]
MAYSTRVGSKLPKSVERGTTTISVEAHCSFAVQAYTPAIAMNTQKSSIKSI